MTGPDYFHAAAAVGNLSVYCSAATPARDRLRAAAASLLLQGDAKAAMLRMRVRGTSMIPALWPGEMIVVEPVVATLPVPGDIVVLADGGQIIVHRLLWIGQDPAAPSRLRVVTAGDTSFHDDAPVDYAGLIGRVRAVHRFGAERAVRRGRGPTAPIFAWMLRRSDLIRRGIDRMAQLWRSRGSVDANR